MKAELAGLAEEYEIGQGLLQILRPLQADGDVTSAEIQETVGRARWVGGGRYWEGRVDVRFEVPVRHPAEGSGRPVYEFRFQRRGPAAEINLRVISAQLVFKAVRQDEIRRG